MLLRKREAGEGISCMTCEIYIKVRNSINFLAYHKVFFYSPFSFPTTHLIYHFYILRSLGNFGKDRHAEQYS